MKTYGLFLIFALMTTGVQAGAASQTLCTLADQCIAGGVGVEFGRAGRITFAMDYPTNANSYSCSATPSVQIWCRGGDADSNWEPITGALLIEGGLMSYSTWQPHLVCKGVIANATTNCTKFSISAVSN